MAEGVFCAEHGERTRAFVCTHLFDALQAGTYADGPWIVRLPDDDDDPEPVAWCLDCERILDVDFTDLKLVCDLCFEPLLAGLPV